MINNQEVEVIHMQVGQKLEVCKSDGRSKAIEVGRIKSIHSRFIVVGFDSHTESFLRVDVENNLDRKFRLIDNKIVKAG